MDFNYDSASIQLTGIPLLAIADFSPSSADASEKLNLVSSMFHLFLAISDNDVVLVEVSPGASVGAPAAASSSWESARHLASAAAAVEAKHFAEASAATWCNQSTGLDAFLRLVLCLLP